MRILISILSLIFIFPAYADQVKVELNPTKPVVGEVFQAVFRIFTEIDDEPAINFSPYKVEVVGKSNYGVKTSSTWINGKFTSSREITIVYDLAASAEGMASLRDITVQVGEKALRHPTLSFNVLKEPEVAADVFVMAEIPKKSIFLGEGVVVRYYLYNKVQVGNLDIKKYPQLNNFLKRFIQGPDRVERVSVDGQIYTRTLIYGAKLFPEKLGDLKIDPLHLTVSVLTSRGNDPFGGFGFGRESKVKTLASEVVKVNVKPLPEEGKPTHFTGLVGKHDFDFQLNRPRLIVNEPLEIKLTVSGGGALENLDAPTILKHPDLEEFESNGDLKIMDAEQATKVFDYTFLPKANFNIPASTISMSYFDPEAIKYVLVNLSMPEIVVAGGTESTRDKSEKISTEQSTKIESPRPAAGLSSPTFENIRSWKFFLNYLNIAILLLAVLIALAVTIKTGKLPSLSQSTVPRSFKAGQFKLGEFAQWIGPLISLTGKSPLTLIKESELKPATKTYFIDLLNSNDYKDYSHAKGEFKFTYKSGPFKELDKYIQSVKNEDTSQTA